jgi:hypothetical protein
MTMSLEFGTLTKVDPRTLAGDGSGALTNWLAGHLGVLGATLGMDLELVNQNGSVGGTSADIIARDTGRDRIVIVENQLDPTDDSRLGRIITFASGQDARVVVWISPEFREPHRQAIEWLNRKSAQAAEFYALGFDVFRVDDSRPAVVFRVMSAPSQHVIGAPAQAARNGAVSLEIESANVPVIEGAPAIAAKTTILNGNGIVNGNGGSNGNGNGDDASQAETHSQEAGNGAASGKPASDSDHQEAYRQFFQRLVDDLREKYRFTTAKMGQPQNWYSFASGTSGVVYSIWFSGAGRVRAELYLDVGNRDLNRQIFDQLRQNASSIEKDYGEKLEWDAAESRRACSVGTYLAGKIDDPPEALEAVLRWAIDRLLRFKKVFGPRLPAVTRMLQQEAR